MIDPIIAIMAIIGIGGGFAVLWWGWLVGETEASMRRALCNLGPSLRLMAEYSKKLGISAEEARKTLIEFSALIVGAWTVDRLKLSAEIGELAPGSVRLPVYESKFLPPGTMMGVPRTFEYGLPPPWSRGRERIGEYNHRKLLACGIDDGIDYRGGLLDPSGGPQEGGAGGLPSDLPADAVEVDPPCDVPGPGTAPPHTEE